MTCASQARRRSGGGQLTTVVQGGGGDLGLEFVQVHGDHDLGSFAAVAG
jgi:hypothetical protein